MPKPLPPPPRMRFNSSVITIAGSIRRNINGQSFEKFVGGFSDTASVSVEIGAPGEIEGAAGSNYIQIPVIISATSTDGSQQKFAGTYTMRSSNMADDKSWYINSAKVRKVQ
jgi:hypothetical protein